MGGMDISSTPRKEGALGVRFGGVSNVTMRATKRMALGRLPVVGSEIAEFPHVGKQRGRQNLYAQLVASTII